MKQELPQNRVRRVIKQDPEIHAAQKQAVATIGAAAQLFIGFFAEQAAARAGGKRLAYRHFAEAAHEVEELQFAQSIVPRQQTLGSILARRKEAGVEGTGEIVDELPEETMEPEDAEDEVIDDDSSDELAEE